MSDKQQWGRKETIVWPPHAPIYTLSAAALGCLVMLFFVWQHLRFSETPLQQTYTTTYVESLVGQTFRQSGTYRLLYVGGGKAAPRLALPADFLPGVTILPGGKKVPVKLSDIARHQGHTVFYQGPAKIYQDAALSRWLRDTFFEGEGLRELYGLSLAEGLLVLSIAIPFGVRADVKRFRELKYGRRLKGPIMLAPAKFNEALKADGLAIETSEKASFPNKKTLLRIPKSAEAKHIQIMGDTGTGKSTILKQLLQQIANRGEVAIVYDPAGEFTESVLQRKPGRLDSESARIKRSPVLDTFERTAEPGGGPHHRGFHVPAARRQAG